MSSSVKNQGSNSFYIANVVIPICVAIVMLWQGYTKIYLAVAVVVCLYAAKTDFVTRFFEKKDHKISIHLSGVEARLEKAEIVNETTGENLISFITTESKLPEDKVMTAIFAGKIVESNVALVDQGVTDGSEILILVHEDNVCVAIEEEKTDAKSSAGEPPALVDTSDDETSSEEDAGREAGAPPTKDQKILTEPVVSSQVGMVPEIVHDAACMISLEKGPEPRFYMMCGAPDIHALTQESLLRYLQGLANDGKFEIHCPNPDCASLWHYPFLRSVLEVGMYDGFTTEVRRELELKLSANLIRQKMNAKRCGSCSIALRRSVFNKNFAATCVACGDRRFCWACLLPWKEGAVACCNVKCPSWFREVTCEVLKSCPTKRIDHMTDVPVLRACPTCGQLITHISDCKHMDCSICHKSFCFICVAPADDRGNYQCGYDADTCRLAARQSKDDLVLTGLRSYSSILGDGDSKDEISNDGREVDFEGFSDDFGSAEFFQKFAADLVQNLEAAGWDEVDYDDDEY